MVRSAIAILSLCALAGPASATTWTKTAATKCGTSATLPGTAAESVESFATADGKVTANLYMVTAGDEVYLVGCNDYERAPTLAQAVTDAVSGVRGTLLKEKPITVAGQKGRELRIQGPGDSRIHARLFLVGGRLHQVLVVSSTGKVPAKTVKKVLTSFRPPRGK